MPKVRQAAAEAVRRGLTPAEVGRRFGVSDSTIAKWVKRAKEVGYHPIPTRSSRPKHHPKQLAEELITKIVVKRLEHGRCAEAVWKELLNEGVVVSLSSVKRTLDRRYLVKKRSPYKRFHPHVDRPIAAHSGDLVQLDTIHRMINERRRLYIFVLLDVYSRAAYARAYAKMSAARSVRFVREAQAQSSFHFAMLQSDHGPEFGKWFVSRIRKNHRYTRIGKPNDNAHIERFNRTLQEECLDKVPNDVRKINRALKEYLKYYNTKRVHLGIDLRSPIQLLSVQAID
jgi:transposase InsO family protein